MRFRMLLNHTGNEKFCFSCNLNCRGCWSPEASHFPHPKLPLLLEQQLSFPCCTNVCMCVRRPIGRGRSRRNTESNKIGKYWDICSSFSPWFLLWYSEACLSKPAWCSRLFNGVNIFVDVLTEFLFDCCCFPPANHYSFNLKSFNFCHWKISDK